MSLPQLSFKKSLERIIDDLQFDAKESAELVELATKFDVLVNQMSEKESGL